MSAEQEADDALVARILAGDSAALRTLVTREHPVLLRFARAITHDPELAREAVQDAWLRIHRSLPSFERRSSLRTWMARIVINRAKTLTVQAARWVPLDADAEIAEETIDPGCFNAFGLWKWSRSPSHWHGETPETLLGNHQVRAAIEGQLETLPAGQRAVLTLRDLEGWSSEEVCNVLEISESNQRVLLHRARAKIRKALEDILGFDEQATDSADSP